MNTFQREAFENALQRVSMLYQSHALLKATPGRITARSQTSTAEDDALDGFISRD